MSKPHARQSRTAGHATYHRATVSDAATVGEMLHAFNVEFDVPTPSARALADGLDRLLVRDDFRVYVAQLDNRIVGFAMLTLRPTPYSTGSIAQLEELFIRSDLRGHGLGGALLESAVSDCESAGTIEVHINVDEDDVATRRFYMRHGYSDTRAGQPWRMLCYLRDLA